VCSWCCWWWYWYRNVVILDASICLYVCMLLLVLVQAVKWRESDECEKCASPFFWNLKLMWEAKTIGGRQVSYRQLFYCWWWWHHSKQLSHGHRFDFAASAAFWWTQPNTVVVLTSNWYHHLIYLPTFYLCTDCLLTYLQQKLYGLLAYAYLIETMYYLD